MKFMKKEEGIYVFLFFRDIEIQHFYLTEFSIIWS